MNYNNQTQPPYNNSPPGNYCWLCGGKITFRYSNRPYWLYPPRSLKPIGMVHKNCEEAEGDEPQRVLK
jgi:hypothetical protein